MFSPKSSDDEKKSDLAPLSLSDLAKDLSLEITVAVLPYVVEETHESAIHIQRLQQKDHTIIMSPEELALNPSKPLYLILKDLNTACHFLKEIAETKKITDEQLKFLTSYTPISMAPKDSKIFQLFQKFPLKPDSKKGYIGKPS